MRTNSQGRILRGQPKAYTTRQQQDQKLIK